MRELKFRVYIPEHEKFSYFKLGDFDYSDRYLHQYEYPVQQFTGLKDSNGVEIYEGDIVTLEVVVEKIKRFYKQSEHTLLPVILEKIKRNKYCGVVKFDGDQGELSHFQYYVDLLPFYTLKSLASKIEVTGNIYENQQRKIS